MSNETLFFYPTEPSPSVKAFSTTRISPFPTSADDMACTDSYAAFNVTDYCGDAPARVERNRQWLATELGIAPERIVMPHQTHSARVAVVGEQTMELTPADRRAQLDGTDALITNVKGVCIGVSTADCVPILLYDAERGACAAVHAGWRGTVKRIPALTIEAMHEAFGTRAEAVQAIIGPSISQQAFEVGDEVVEAFREADFDTSALVRRMAMHPGGEVKAHIDLWAANAMLLEAAGVQMEHIRVSGICTYAHHDTFFSARRLGIRSGRIFTGIMMA